MSWIKNNREILIGSVGTCIICAGIYKIEVWQYFVVMLGLAIHAYGAIAYGARNERER